MNTEIHNGEDDYVKMEAKKDWSYTATIQGISEITRIWKWQRQIPPRGYRGSMTLQMLIFVHRTSRTVRA
jgi:hypothetical protein